MSKQLSNANSHSCVEGDRREADFEEYCRDMSRQIDECLHLLQSIEKSSAGGKSPRTAVVEHCRRYSIPERTFWYYLACYVERRTFSLDDRPDTPFRVRDEYLRKQILSLLPRIPHRALDDFRRLVSFTTNFLDRATYLTDWLLSSFLEKAIESSDDAPVLNQELFSLCESIVISAIGVIHRSMGNEFGDEPF